MALWDWIRNKLSTDELKKICFKFQKGGDGTINE